ncbi:ORF2 protein [Dioscorea bacilliform RT virus 1]|uniref:ORF2 protein n=1 Tax=Dioscorea bacilliform RT virus 1 TaxID=2169727 RepID=A0A3G1E448_9VIRU|nr:ORF2 protein [Dioscorea bacilliform RT virus 1]ANV20886.1 ORF2 protein [Dioscorea bacilliform RT virus 1]ANV20892.1 ORF2 protein [Dioscorea bacilliform RT virus]
MNHTEEYKRALQATEAIDPPAVGYIKPTEKLALAVINLQKQNNTLTNLITQIFEKLTQIQTEVRSLKSQASPVAASDELLDKVITKLGRLSIADKLPEKQGKLLVFKDPVLIYQEEAEKLKRR